MIDDSPIATGIVSAHDSITPRNESIRKPKPQKKTFLFRNENFRIVDIEIKISLIFSLYQGKYSTNRVGYAESQIANQKLGKF